MTNLELCKLSVMLLTDGYVSKNRYTYEIGFVNNSEILLKMFQKLARNIFGIKKFGMYHKSSGAWVTRFYSKTVGKKLLKHCKTFRTKAFDNKKFPKPRLPTNINKIDKTTIAKLLRLAFTLDGGLAIGIGKNRTEVKILLKCYNPHLRNTFSRMLNKLGIHHIKNNEGLFIRNRASIIEYTKVIGFEKGVRVGHDSKRFYGIEKQQLLKAISKTIKNNSLNEFGLTVRQAGAKPFQCISV